MKKSKQSNHGLAPLDLRIQDHYEELLTVIKAAKLTGFSKQYIYRQTKSNLLRSCRVKGVMYIKYRHLRSWFIKLPSNHECTFCPASLSLIGLMNLTKEGVVGHYVLSIDTTFVPIIWAMFADLILMIRLLPGT